MTNIYDKSGLSLQTFYNFFDDKEDVVRRCIHDLLQSARSDDKTDEEEFLDTAKRYLKVLDEHTAFFRTVIDQRLDYIIRSEIVTLLIDLLNRLAHKTTHTPMHTEMPIFRAPSPPYSYIDCRTQTGRRPTSSSASPPACCPQITTACSQTNA